MLKSAAVIFVFTTLGKSFNGEDYHLLLLLRHSVGNILWWLLFLICSGLFLWTLMRVCLKIIFSHSYFFSFAFIAQKHQLHHHLLLLSSSQMSCIWFCKLDFSTIFAMKARQRQIFSLLYNFLFKTSFSTKTTT